MLRAGHKAAWTAAGLLTLAMVGEGCSAAGDGTTPSAERKATQHAALTGSTTGSPLVPMNYPPGPLQMGPTHAYSVPMAPSTVCSIHPAGVTDPTRTVSVVAHADGKVRFDLAPSAQNAWGTKLALDCGPTAAVRSVLVDLNDSSTFTAESAASLRPVKTGVRAALTGDLTAMSNSQLAQAKYPMRPDAASPLYAKWVQMVSSAVDVYSAIPVAILGLHNTGSFVTSYTGRDIGWSGFVQAGGGFHIASSYPYVAEPATLYGAYQALTFAPYPNGCWGGNCDDSALWAGTGGAWVWASPTFSPALLQSGFQLIFGSTIDLFAEYYPNGVDAFQSPYTLNSGDEVFFEGYDGDSSCNFTTGTPTNGCFIYEDLSQGDWVLTDVEAWPSGATFYPASAEYITEWHPGAGTNDNYGGDEMIGDAMDMSGTWHDDPGNTSGSDPYIVFDSLDTNGSQCATVEWNNGTIYSPQDPMYFFPDECGPN